MPDTLSLDDFSLEITPPGTCWKGWIHIGELPAGEPVRWPVVLHRGQQPGKVLLANAGTHGDEYEGIAALHKVARQLDPQTMTGTLLSIPILSPPAVTGGHRNGIWDNRNLARTFPGDASGLFTERIAHHFATRILPLADLYIDLHAAGTGVGIETFIGCRVDEENDLVDTQRRASIATGMEIIWNTGGLPGRTLSAAWDAGVPALYTESPGNRTCDPDEVDIIVTAIMNLLRFLEILPGSYPTERPAFYFEDSRPAAGHMQDHHRSDVGGLFIPEVKLWERVEEGQCLGNIYDPLGDVLQVISASLSGRVLTLRICPRVMPGEFTTVVVPFVE